MINKENEKNAGKNESWVLNEFVLVFLITFGSVHSPVFFKCNMQFHKVTPILVFLFEV